VIVVLLVLIGCTTRQPHEPPVVLAVTLESPYPFGITVKARFESNPDNHLCRGRSIATEEIIPLTEGFDTTLPPQTQRFYVPLKWQERSYCEYAFKKAAIILTDSLDENDRIDVINVYRDLMEDAWHIELPDTVFLTCGDCDTMYCNDYKSEFCCLKHNQKCESPDFFYSLPKTNSDTLNLTISARFLQAGESKPVVAGGYE